MRVGTALRTPRWAAWALVAGVLVAGCSDPDQPGTVPRTSPTPTSSSPSPTPTTVEAQVEAAVRTYYAELTKASSTNDTSTLKTLVARSCPCYRPISVIDRGAAKGERAPDAAWRLRSVRVHDIAGKTAAAEVKYHVTAYDVVDSSGRVLTHIKADESHFDLSLVESAEGWIISNVFDMEG
jgi:hypothetical protein